MIKEMILQLKTAILCLIAFSILTGLIYPLLVTVIAQLAFPWQANGSLIMRDNKPIASLLIGQSFTSNAYFSSRPSATTPYPYNALASNGSNSGPTNKDFLALLKKRASQLQAANPRVIGWVPVDLVTASASGLDPEISVAAAIYQVPRVATARRIKESEVLTLVDDYIQYRTLTLLGEPRVNVVALNLALDAMTNKESHEKR